MGARPVAGVIFVIIVVFVFILFVAEVQVLFQKFLDSWFRLRNRFT